MGRGKLTKFFEVLSGSCIDVHRTYCVTGMLAAIGECKRTGAKIPALQKTGTRDITDERAVHPRKGGMLYLIRN